MNLVKVENYQINSNKFNRRMNLVKVENYQIEFSTVCDIWVQVWHKKACRKYWTDR